MYNFPATISNRILHKMYNSCVQSKFVHPTEIFLQKHRWRAGDKYHVNCDSYISREHLYLYQIHQVTSRKTKLCHSP